jgi:imidazolonepropionase-like amidohydrolase
MLLSPLLPLATVAAACGALWLGATSHGGPMQDPPAQDRPAEGPDAQGPIPRGPGRAPIAGARQDTEPPAALSPPPIQAFVGARILTVAGPVIDDGVLVVEGSRIVAVGRRGEVGVPDGAVTHDVSGKVLMPGLVCTHSHIGGIGGADRSGPIQPDVRIYDSLNVRDSGFKRALAGGLTTLNIMPGSGHLLSGQTIYVKLRAGNTVEDLFVRDAEGRPMGGMKMANGTNPIGESPFPGTRGKSAALIRKQLLAAQEYRAKIAAAAGDPDELPGRNLALEGLVEVLDGKRVVHHHTHRHDDIVTVLRLAEEFGFRVVLHHVSEGWKVADEIAAAGVPCSIILLDSPGGKLEAVDLDMRTGALLEAAGVKVAYHTDDWITDSRHFMRMGALGVRAGLSRGSALRALTLHGAEILDIGERTGSLEPGKDADFVVLDGDPFSVYTKVLETWVEGVKRFDRADPADRLYAEGGYGAGHDQNPYFCCYGEHQ